jgi:hypothetical protein
MSEFSRKFLLLISFALIMACASNPRVQSKVDDSLDFSVYETYNFGTRTEIENPDLPDTLELYFSAAVERQLLLKGLVRSDEPDILINVSVDVEDVSAAPVRANNCPRYDDYFSRRVADSYAGEGRRPMCIYTEGSIVIELVDVELNRTIGEGTSRVRMDERDRGASLVRSVSNDVAEMFGETPVRGGNPVTGMGSVF